MRYEKTEIRPSFRLTRSVTKFKLDPLSSELKVVPKGGKWQKRMREEVEDAAAEARPGSKDAA